MKKFLSIFIALLLIVSLFATTAVAFAEEVTTPSEGESTTTPETPDEGDGEGEGEPEEPEVPREPVTVNADKLEEYLNLDAWFKNLKLEMGDIKFGETLMKDSTKIAEAFPNIKYVISGDEDYDDKKADNDKIIVEYCRPSESPKGQETWQNSVNITESIRISTSGWYLFRFVVKDKDNEVLVRGERHYSFYSEDTSRPVVSLSTTMKNKVESGLTAEAKYTIPTSGLTSGSTDEMSSTTVNFKIYKFVKGSWTAEPIYDSVTKEIAEGYEDFVDVDGAITPSKADISEKPVYKIVYSVKDAYGFTGVEEKSDIHNYSALEFNPEMLLKVVEAPAEDGKSVNVWVIVLFSIAGACAIGIVVLLLIQPKQQVAPAKATKAAEQADEQTTDETQE